ncbi:hypothetical protein LEMLEM_LOCUS18844, partial [Lemmus lemmus]
MAMDGRGYRLLKTLWTVRKLVLKGGPSEAHLLMLTHSLANLP